MKPVMEEFQAELERKLPKRRLNTNSFYKKIPILKSIFYFRTKLFYLLDTFDKTLHLILLDIMPSISPNKLVSIPHVKTLINNHIIPSDV
jgi:hypothetical protein